MMIRTRFAPSPTGKLHVGGLRTALYSWAFARHHGGEFVLRVEDTDTERNNQKASAGILTSLAWAGLKWDEGPIYQSDRLDRYQEVVQKLLDTDMAYYSTDTTKHEATAQEKFRGNDRDEVRMHPPEGSYVIRAKIPMGVIISYDDMVKGPVQSVSDDVEDWVLFRSNGTPTYNFAVVVDDIDMNITHVIRGDDHVNNTPKQWLLYQALGASVPVFGHIPMILDAQGKKLSKRTIDTVSLTQSFPVDVESARAQGLTPAGLLNYLARLGWSKDNREVFDLSTLVSIFDGTGIQSSAARVDSAKLHWVNAEHLKKMNNAELYTWAIQQENVVDSPTFSKNFADIADGVRQRSDKTSSFVRDFAFLSKLCLKTTSFNLHNVDSNVILLSWSIAQENLLKNEWSAAGIDAALRQTALDAGCKFGDIAKSFRLSLSDEKATPPVSLMFLALGAARLHSYFEDSLAFCRPSDFAP